MRKKFRFLTILAVCVMVLSCFSVTAFAYADDTEQNLPVTEATQPEQQPAVTPTPEKPDRKSTRLNSSHSDRSRMPSSA